MSATTRVSSPTASLPPDALSASSSSLHRSHPGGAVPPPADAALGGSTAGAATASMTSGASKLRRPPPLAAAVSSPPPAVPVPGRSSPDADACVPAQHNACQQNRGGERRERTARALKRGQQHFVRQPLLVPSSRTVGPPPGPRPRHGCQPRAAPQRRKGEWKQRLCVRARRAGSKQIWGLQTYQAPPRAPQRRACGQPLCVSFAP